ncbi:hypothetical protein HYU13_05000 [Candidatus Woesearchaeota archaeon]|nr:hypothetical protein [Candidatus Woesearchaeota archaeon]
MKIFSHKPLKKGEALPLNVIIIALIVLVVLVVIWLIFTGRIGVFGKTTKAGEETIKAIGVNPSTGDITGATAPKPSLLFPFIPFFARKKKLFFSS